MKANLPRAPLPEKAEQDIEEAHVMLAEAGGWLEQIDALLNDPQPNGDPE